MEKTEEKTTIWIVFNNFCKVNSLDFKAEIRRLSVALFYNKTEELEYQLKNSSFEVFYREKLGKEHLEGKKRTYLFWMRTLHFFYSIPLENFGLPKSVTLTPFFQYDNKQDLGTIIQLSISDDERKNKLEIQKEYLKTYYTPLKEALVNVKKSYVAYDYIEKQNFSNPNYLLPYFEANAKIYQDLEEKLTSINGFEYTRFLALPRRLQINDELKKLCDNNETIYSLASVLDHCSLSLFEHLCRCIFHHRNCFDNRNSGFFMVSEPPKTYHWVIMDDGKYILSEYYSFKYGICKPDLMFLGKLNSETKKLLNAYNNEKEQLLWVNHDNTYNPPIEFDEDFEIAMTALEIFAENCLVQKHDKSSSERLFITEYAKITANKYKFYSSLKERKFKS